MAKKAPIKKTPVKKEFIKLDPVKMYDLVLTEDTFNMKKGTYTMDGAIAEILVNKGIGKIK